MSDQYTREVNGMSEDSTISPLARDIQRFREECRGKQADQEWRQSVIAYEMIGDILDDILDKHDAQEPPVELVVEFRQRFTVAPPEGITDPISAEDWFWNIYSEMGHDVIDTGEKDDYEVLAVRPRDFDE